MIKYIDPPSGWRYGFPKALPNPEPEDINQWLVENGYPKSLIESFGDFFFCRFWTEDDTKELHR